MSDEIVVISPRDVGEVKTLSTLLAASNLMPQALKKKPEDVLAIVLAGAELKLAPMQAIRGMNIINGRVSLSADLMGALVKNSPICEYLQLKESTGSVATYATKRKGEPGETVLSFTIEQAKAAGLNGDNWRKYPEAMLRARALSAICRAVYPDLCVGLYDSDSGEIEEKPVPTTPIAEHAASVKEQLRSAITDAEVVEVKPTIDSRIEAAASIDALKALVPELRTLPAGEQARLKVKFDARRKAVS